jgi:hypothetical protein
MTGSPRGSPTGLCYLLRRRSETHRSPVGQSPQGCPNVWTHHVTAYAAVEESLSDSSRKVHKCGHSVSSIPDSAAIQSPKDEAQVY